MLFISVFLLLLLTSKQISAVVLAVFQGRYPRAIIMQLIRQSQWTDTKATSEELISFLENKKGAVRNDQKIYSHLIYDFCMRVKTFKVATSLYIFSTTQPSMAQQRKQMKNKFLIIFKT